MKTLKFKWMNLKWFEEGLRINNRNLLIVIFLGMYYAKLPPTLSAVKVLQNLNIQGPLAEMFLNFPQRIRMANIRTQIGEHLDPNMSLILSTSIYAGHFLLSRPWLMDLQDHHKNSRCRCQLEDFGYFSY